MHDLYLKQQESKAVEYHGITTILWTCYDTSIPFFGRDIYHDNILFFGTFKLFGI